jgi:hypothetical protein
LETIKYFKAVVRYEVESGSKSKTIKEEYLVDALSVAEANILVTEKLTPEFTLSGNEFEVISVTPTKIRAVI